MVSIHWLNKIIYQSKIRKFYQPPCIILCIIYKPILSYLKIQKFRYQNNTYTKIPNWKFYLPQKDLKGPLELYQHEYNKNLVIWETLRFLSIHVYELKGFFFLVLQVPRNFDKCVRDYGPILGEIDFSLYTARTTECEH